MSRPVGAIDLGGTSVRAAVVDGNGGIAGFVAGATEASQGPDAVIDRIVGVLHDSLARASVDVSELAAVGIGAPGPLDWATGVIHEAPNLPGWKEVPLAARIGDAVGLPAFLENDANAAALAENQYGVAQGSRNMLYITVSTGVGGGLILDGELWHGAYGSAGEFGHMTVDFDGPLCDCGNRGCIEALAAGPDIAAWVADRIAEGRSSSLGGQTDPSGRDVVEAAQRGDELATEALARAGRAVGFGIVNVAHLVNLDTVVIGGGIANAGDLLFDPLRATVRQHLLESTAPNLRLEPWSLGENVGLLGAAAAARSRLQGGV
ncbi:MAG: ROK family protein [Chloroflexota bacterium]|nr:ROK family protein [Chloroflexota bacterium]MDE2899209.1 ROK family protein [Chloroflexota bacterium]